MKPMTVVSGKMQEYLSFVQASTIASHVQNA